MHQPCPHCGRCPGCGRTSTPPHWPPYVSPYVQKPYTLPYPRITGCGTAIQPQSFPTISN